ncbi:MAG: hypothetical protein KAH95_05185, partial [Spirochaetales bacterium]|nr:hypothetical protein [Spirochaetales bacterium]
NSIVTPEEFEYFRKYLMVSNKSNFTANSLEKILLGWRQRILKNCETPMEYLRECFLYEPSSSLIVYNNIIAIIKVNISSKNESDWFSIIRQCPQLDFDFLL